jgi:hypothetical protein
MSIRFDQERIRETLTARNCGESHPSPAFSTPFFNQGYHAKCVESVPGSDLSVQVKMFDERSGITVGRR